MQCLEVSGAVRLIYRSLGVKGLNGTLPEKQCTLSISLFPLKGMSWKFKKLTLHASSNANFEILLPIGALNLGLAVTFCTPARNDASLVYNRYEVNHCLYRGSYWRTCKKITYLAITTHALYIFHVWLGRVNN